jgi:hypothetical protein
MKLSNELFKAAREGEYGKAIAICLSNRDKFEDIVRLLMTMIENREKTLVDYWNRGQKENEEQLKELAALKKENGRLKKELSETGEKKDESMGDIVGVFDKVYYFGFNESISTGTITPRHNAASTLIWKDTGSEGYKLATPEQTNAEMKITGLKKPIKIN